MEKVRIKIKQLWFIMLNLSNFINVLFYFNRWLFWSTNKFHRICWYAIIWFYSYVNSIREIGDNLLTLECELSVWHVFVWLGAVGFCALLIEIKPDTHVTIETCKFKHILLKFYFSISCKVHMIISYLLWLKILVQDDTGSQIMCSFINYLTSHDVDCLAWAND